MWLCKMSRHAWRSSRVTVPRHAEISVKAFRRISGNLKALNLNFKVSSVWISLSCEGPPPSMYCSLRTKHGAGPDQLSILAIAVIRCGPEVSLDEDKIPRMFHLIFRCIVVFVIVCASTWHGNWRWSLESTAGFPIPSFIVSFSASNCECIVE